MDSEKKPIVTLANDSEYAEITSFADKCFKKDENSGYFKRYYPKLYREKNFDGKAHYTVRENGKIIALAGLFRNTLKVGDSSLHYAGIGTVCVDEAYRGRGLMQILLNRMVDDARKEGLDFVFLGGRRQRYELFGITPSGVSATYVFNKDNARHLYGKDRSFGYEFRTINESDDEVLNMIYSLFMSKTCRAFRERDRLYDTLCSGFNHIEGVFKDGAFSGYLLTGETRQTIVEAEFADISETGRILNDYLNKYVLFNAEICFVFPFETKKNLFFSRHGEGVNIKNCESIRVLDFKNMTKVLMELKASYSALSDGALSVSVTGEKGFIIRVKDGNVSIGDLTGEPDISLSLLDAQNLFFGAWGYVCDREARLPSFANTWFPLPFFLNRPDFV